MQEMIDEYMRANPGIGRMTILETDEYKVMVVRKVKYPDTNTLSVQSLQNALSGQISFSSGGYTGSSTTYYVSKEREIFKYDPF